MIYTLTLNPSIDYVMSISQLRHGHVNRSAKRRFIAAGKGINVSRALQSMGVQSVAVFVCGCGFVGEEFKRLLAEEDLNSVIIPVHGCDTRINVKLRQAHESSVTEINGSFSVGEGTVCAVNQTLSELGEGDFLIISGSLPCGFPVDFYAKITEELSKKGVYVIVDTSGKPLKEVVKTQKAFLLKPNQHELSELSGVEIRSVEYALIYGKKIKCRNVLASLGQIGAVLINNDSETAQSYICRSQEITKGYTVGAGDALLAGFVAQYIKSEDYEKALQAGVNAATQYINDGH
jgi:1-phosphofructokinase